MPESAATTKPLQVSNSDFVCNKTNVLWLLGQSKFYQTCPAFGQLWPKVKELYAFIQDKGLADGGNSNAKCSNCAAQKAVKAQALLLDAFAQIFLHLIPR